MEAISIPKRRKLTAKQEGFVKDFLETKNASEAVRRNYAPTTTNTVKAIATENLAKPSIQEKIETLKQTFVDDSYYMYGQQKEILERVKQRNPELANKIINKVLDRAGLAPVTKSESKNMSAKFVITRGNSDELTNESSPPTTPL